MGKGLKELAVCAVIAVTPQARAADARLEPVSDRVVRTMLWLADVSSADVVYALGCTDARLVITAVRRFGARAVCIDADRARVVSYGHGMGDWKPQLTAHVRSGGLDRPVYLWSVPVR